MVINLLKNFHQTQSFFIVWNEKQMIFLLGKTGSRERKSLNFKRSSKTFTQDTKATSNYIYRLYHSVICFHLTVLYYQKQILFILRKIGSREIKLLNFKRSSKSFPRIQKPYQVPYIFCNTLLSASIQPFYASRLPPTETVGLQWICRAQLFIDTTHLPFCLPWNYVTSPLTYSRGQLRINRGITVLRCC